MPHGAGRMKRFVSRIMTLCSGLNCTPVAGPRPKATLLPAANDPQGKTDADGFGMQHPARRPILPLSFVRPGSFSRRRAPRRRGYAAESSPIQSTGILSSPPVGQAGAVATSAAGEAGTGEPTPGERERRHRGVLTCLDMVGMWVITAVWPGGSPGPWVKRSANSHEIRKAVHRSASSCRPRQADRAGVPGYRSVDAERRSVPSVIPSEKSSLRRNWVAPSRVEALPDSGASMNSDIGRGRGTRAMNGASVRPKLQFYDYVDLVSGPLIVVVLVSIGLLLL